MRIAPEDQGDRWMEEILPRRNQLEAPGGGQHRPAAAGGRASAQVDLLLLDRLLLTAVTSDIEPLILLNKTDLDDEDLLARMQAAYGGCFPVLGISTVTGEGFGPGAHGHGGSGLLPGGQSAVGKSSLINALLPGLSLETDRSPAWIAAGTPPATPRCCPPGRAAGGGHPGLFAAGLRGDAPEDLADGYPDYADLAEQCKFQVCLHDREPGCAVRAAVEAGSLDAGRYERYRVLLKRNTGEMEDRL